MPGVEELLVVFLDEVSVGCVGDLELEPQLFKDVVVVIGKESLNVTNVEPSPVVLKRRVWSER